MHKWRCFRLFSFLFFLIETKISKQVVHVDVVPKPPKCIWTENVSSRIVEPNLPKFHPLALTTQYGTGGHSGSLNVTLYGRLTILKCKNTVIIIWPLTRITMLNMDKYLLNTGKYPT